MVFPRIPHSSYSLLWRYTHILLKNSEKIGGHVLNKKNILSVLHAPLFLPFSRRTQLVCDVLTFTLTSFSDKWLINLAMSPKCPLILQSAIQYKKCHILLTKVLFLGKTFGVWDNCHVKQLGQMPRLWQFEQLARDVFRTNANFFKI